MKITINAPKGEMELYKEEVARQLKEGYTSGYVDSETNWDSEDDEE